MREFWVAASLLWLAGVGLRLSILAVPPVILLIQADLRLSGTEVGVLSGLPLILFAIAALPGSLLIARFGALATLASGLVIAGVASGLRGAVLDVLAFYAATVVMSAGIAIMQPALPPLEGSWRWALAIWGLPLVLIAILTMALAPARKELADAPAAVRWWPDWRNKLIWQVGILLGSVNSVYFCCNAFLPGHLTAAGRPDLISAALTALNFGQLPASFALLAVADRLVRRAWPFILCGGLMLLCLAGIVMTASLWTIAYAGALGFLGAGVFTLALALPPLLSAPADLARVSAAIFAICYSEALLVSVLSGAAWDLGGNPRFAFVPMAASALPLLFVPVLVRFRQPQQAPTS
jgi:CP family cyanate transporter-like MFS transporter